ncbi:nitroreductase/quinone reductase family protein [Brevibacterium picturae]|uniref:Cupin type-2 domain-containing protein n=1 Tax=Brevibacterium picturae TaxID=260553 RepID=A0ABN2CII0_9MICO
MIDLNDTMIKEFRANNGRVDSAGFGFGPVLLHTRDTDNSTERITPVLSLRDGDDWFVAVPEKGAPHEPAWVVDLRAHPDIDIEALVDDEIRTIAVHAHERDGESLSSVIRLVSREAEISAQRRPAPVAPAPVAPDDLSRDISVRRPDSDESLAHYGVVGDNYTMVLNGEDTAGRFALIDMLVPAGGGPPPHRHDFEEMFYILEGQIDITFRGETTIVNAGEVVNIPARAPHFFHNFTDADARMLCLVSPPGLDEYFSQWGQPLPTRTALNDLSAEEAQRSMSTAIEMGPHYAIENLPPA